MSILYFSTILLHNTFTFSEYSIELVVVILFFLLVVTAIQIAAKKRLKKAYNRIKEDADIISEQNEEINIQFDDIKQKNRELIKYQSHLEKVDKTKTDKLAIAIEKAEESEKLKSNLLSNIYHEIRTPLNAIIGFVQLLSIEEEIKNTRYIQIIEKNADDLLLLVDNMIELSKLQASGRDIVVNEIKISDFIKKIHNESISVKNVLFKNNLAIKLSLEGNCNCEFIYNDEERLYKILKQLIDNAFKYTDEGQITIGCNKEQNRLQFYVKDTGIGIEKEKLASIFSAFHKIEDHSNLYRGMGLGLTLARQLTTQIQADLHVESELHKGTKFILSVPDLRKDYDPTKKSLILL